MKVETIRSAALVIAAIVASIIPTSGTVAPAVAKAAPAANFTNITKSFEFGPGTPNAVSNQRGFEIPSGLEVAATVKYRRLGTGKEGIPIAIELREPDTSPGVEGPIVKTERRDAYVTEGSVTIRSLASNRGCTRPWRVRVRYDGTGTPPNAVFGTARLDWDGTTRTISAETPGYVIKGTSKEVKFGDATGFGEGAIAVTANWNHMIGPVPGPSPVKFNVALYVRLPNGDDLVGPADEGYSTNEANATPRFGLIYRLSSPLAGQYRLNFKNKDVHDAFVQTPTVRFSPTCA